MCILKDGRAMRKSLTFLERSGEILQENNCKMIECKCFVVLDKQLNAITFSKGIVRHSNPLLSFEIILGNMKEKSAAKIVICVLLIVSCLRVYAFCAAASKMYVFFYQSENYEKPIVSFFIIFKLSRRMQCV